MHKAVIIKNLREIFSRIMKLFENGIKRDKKNIKYSEWNFNVEKKCCKGFSSIINTMFNCLHFHVIEKDNYVRKFPKVISGSFILQDIYINTLINNIKFNNNYYKNFNNKILIPI